MVSFIIGVLVGMAIFFSIGIVGMIITYKKAKKQGLVKNFKEYINASKEQIKKD